MLTLYTQPACRSCDRVKAKLHEAGVRFTIVDISEDQDAWAYLVNNLEAKSTPVIETLDGEVILGYQPDKLKTLIERNSN